jgi:hypothetical protein
MSEGAAFAYTLRLAAGCAPGEGQSVMGGAGHRRVGVMRQAYAAVWLVLRFRLRWIIHAGRLLMGLCSHMCADAVNPQLMSGGARAAHANTDVSGS